MNILKKPSKIFKLFTTSLFLVFILHSVNLQAEEQILDYKVDIFIQKDSSLYIEEKITVIAEKKKIKRGIYRDFPTIYTNKNGTRVKVGFKLHKILKDGKPEDYHTRTQSNGIRIYIGNKNRYVKTGEHTYELYFKTNRQLGFFEDHDELYFNAIPHGFEFPIRQALVTVHMPQAVPEGELQLTAYTGKQGSKAKNYSSWSTGSNATFSLSQELRPREGMTVVVGFPKGIVTKPSSTDEVLWFLEDNLPLAIGILSFLLINGLYIHIWRKVGRDPKAGTIIPRWEPPEGLSAADVRYIQKRYSDFTTLTACLVDLCTKGWVRIDETDGDKVIFKESGKGELEGEEKELFDALLKTREFVELDKTNHSHISAAKSAFDKSLESQHAGKAFKLNRSYFAMLFGASFVAILIMFLTLVLQNNSPLALYCVALVGIFLVSNIVFMKLLERHTIFGRKILDKIEGFKMYLETAEPDTFRDLGAPEDTFDIFEKYLPYAVALDVDYNWGTRFKKQIEAAIQSGTISTANQSLYRDTYQNNFFSSNGLSRGLSSTIASASSPPGSSGSGSSGGSSGGGGGGGGGGGW